MNDGSVVVLFPDGSVCKSLASNSNQTAEKSIDLTQSLNLETNANRPLRNGLPDEKSINCDWNLSNSLGERYSRDKNGAETKLSDLLVSYAVCPKTSQVGKISNFS